MGILSMSRAEVKTLEILRGWAEIGPRVRVRNGQIFVCGGRLGEVPIPEATVKYRRTDDGHHVAEVHVDGVVLELSSSSAPQQDFFIPIAAINIGGPEPPCPACWSAPGHARLEHGDARGALEMAEQAIALDQFHEASWRLALQADHALGLRESATRRYDELAHAARRTTRAPTTRETRLMYRQLLQARATRTLLSLTVGDTDVALRLRCSGS